MFRGVSSLFFLISRALCSCFFVSRFLFPCGFLGLFLEGSIFLKHIILCRGFLGFLANHMFGT